MSTAQKECVDCVSTPGFHAGLHTGHVWTNTGCPAYTTLDGDDCNCNGEVK